MGLEKFWDLLFQFRKNGTSTFCVYYYIIVQSNTVTNPVTFSPGSLHEGDEIAEINGTTVANQSVDQLQKILVNISSMPLMLGPVMA